MYAVRRTYVKNWDFEGPTNRYEVSVKRGGEAIESIKPERISSIDEEVMYWRKANHIHNWFVENVQDGIDNCGYYYVDQEKLKELLDACNQVIESSALVEAEIKGAKSSVDEKTARDVLPHREGFFFGNYDYDEWYLGDTVATRDWIIQTLDETERGATGAIYYHSSW